MRREERESDIKAAPKSFKNGESKMTDKKSHVRTAQRSGRRGTAASFVLHSHSSCAGQRSGLHSHNQHQLHPQQRGSFAASVHC
jgi:hypothetical protein